MAQEPNPAAVQALKIIEEGLPDEKEEDPGLIILYNVDAVHTALQHPTAPVQQGANMAQSVDNGAKYVYTKVMGTPCTWQNTVSKRPALTRRVGSIIPIFSIACLPTCIRLSLSDWWKKFSFSTIL